ncbi:MAG: hypothetical protein EZS28_055690, partial [Streblomastix strix]
ATGENKLVDRFVAIEEEEEEAEWLNAFSRPWKEGIFWIHPPIPKIVKALIAWERFQTNVSHDSTLVARSNMVHVLTNRQQQIPYSWRELSDSEPGEGDDQDEGHVTTRKNRGIPHGPRVDRGRRILTEFLDNINMTRETQKMIIEGQKYNIQKKYMQTIEVFEDWMKEKNYTVQDIMNQKIPFIHSELMTWQTRT